MKIFDIKSEFDALRELVETVDFDTETGEVKDNSKLFKSLLDEVELKVGEKLESIEYIKREINSGIEALKTEETRLYKKRKALENNIERLKELQVQLLSEFPEHKTKTDKGFSFYMQESESVILMPFVTPEMLPEQYKTTRMSIEPNKTALKNAIKSGELVNGVEIEKKSTLRVR